MVIQNVNTTSANGRWQQQTFNTPVQQPKINLFPYRYNSAVKSDSFSNHTLSLMYYQSHKSNLLTIAQNYLGRIIEVSPKEYAQMGFTERMGTQQAFIGKYGTIDEDWCAHTVSFMCEQAGINIGGHKKGVSQFISWGKSKGIYKPIQTNEICPINYIQERENRTKQIKQQFKHLKEGDLIVWKSDRVTITQNGFHMDKASHIGIFEGFNPDGTISVLEGNANEFKTGKYEKYIATNEKEAKNGNQRIGEPQEVNLRDGFIRKTYTAEQLASGGYSGYISMQSLIK